MSKIALRIYNIEINDMIDQEQVDIAITHCLHILKTYPKFVETYRLLGKAYLEAKQFENAADVFQRVLSSHPDDFVANVGMSIVGESNEDYDSAIHFMERAFEEQPSNNAIQEEMKRLFGLRDGIEPTKVRLTRGALSRMYVHGNLYDQAVAELLSIINESPQRLDLLVILAETYFVQNKNTEAAEVCMNVLNDLPYSYLANRIMYLILTEDDRNEKAQEYLTRWIELDPYAEFITPPAYKSEEVSDNTIEIEKLEMVEGISQIEEEVFEKAVESELETTEPEQELDLLEEAPQVLDESKETEAMDIGDDIPDWLFGEDEKEAGEIAEQTEETDKAFEQFIETIKVPVEEDKIDDAAELDDPETLIPLEDEEPDKSEDDWLSSLEKVSLDKNDTWPSLIESEKRPVTNSGSLKIDDTENLEWLSDLVEKEETDERPNWEEITGTLPPLPKDKDDEEAEAIEDLFSTDEEEAEDAVDVPSLMEPEVDEVEAEVADEEIEVDEAESDEIKEEKTEEAIVETIEETDADDLPSWMKSAGDQLETEKSDEIGDLPDWMKSKSKAEPDEAVDVQIQEEEPKKELEKIDEEADQAWLNSLAETVKTKTLEDDSMPDWLKQIDSGKNLDKLGDQISTEDAEEISSLPEDNLPEWLKDLKEEEFGERSAIDALLSEDEEQEEAVSDVEVISEAEIIGEEDTSTQPALETEIAEDETEAGDDETPDWMQALRGIADDVPISEELDEKKPDIQAESEKIKIDDEEIQFDLEKETEEVEKQEEPDVTVVEEQEEPDETVEEEITEHEIDQVESSDWVPEIDIDETSEIEKEAEDVISDEISPPVAEQPELEPGMAELLEEARRSLQDGDMDATSTIFKKLIRKGKNIPDVITILKEGLETHPIDVSLWQLLGDALMRDDKLSDAMEAYTNAEELIR